MTMYRDSKEARRLAGLVHKAETARLKRPDRWGLQPVARGWLRGQVANLRQWDEPCEYGMLQIMEFDLCPERDKPGVPVRMTATYFGNRLMDGQVIDIPDPTPSVRPITPNRAIFSHSNPQAQLVAYYPGRDAESLETSRLLAASALIVPAIALGMLLVALHFVFHVY